MFAAFAGLNPMEFSMNFMCNNVTAHLVTMAHGLYTMYSCVPFN